MAEAAGLAIGIVGLASLFNTVVEDLGYIQFARNFGSDFQVSMLQLENAQLRLSRWGKSIGLSDVDSDTESLRGTLLSEEDIKPAEKLLKGIRAQLERTEKKSKEYAKAKDGKSLTVYSPEKDLSYSGLSLRDIGRKLVKARHNGGLSKSKKAKWALYDREHFKELIDSVTQLTSELIELFPAAKDKQEELREKEEIAAFTGPLRQLMAAISNQDDALAEALGRLLNPQTESYSFKTSGGTFAVQGKNAGRVDQKVTNHHAK